MNLLPRRPGQSEGNEVGQFALSYSKRGPPVMSVLEHLMDQCASQELSQFNVSGKGH